VIFLMLRPRSYATVLNGKPVVRNSLISSGKGMPGNLEEYQDVGFLDLSSNGLEKLPEAVIIFMQKEYTEMLSLALNKLTDWSLPSSFWDLTKLVDLNLSSNLLETIPQGLGKLQNLIRLDISNNKIVYLPQEIRNLKKLIHLVISNNLLRTLPVQIYLLQLEILDLSNNPLITSYSLPLHPKVLTLKEICARHVLNRGYTPISDRIPASLEEYLQKGRKCGYCYKFFLDESVNFVDFANLAPGIRTKNTRVPLVTSMCSLDCARGSLLHSWFDRINRNAPR